MIRLCRCWAVSDGSTGPSPRLAIDGAREATTDGSRVTRHRRGWQRRVRGLARGRLIHMPLIAVMVCDLHRGCSAHKGRVRLVGLSERSHASKVLAKRFIDKAGARLHGDTVPTLNHEAPSSGPGGCAAESSEARIANFSAKNQRSGSRIMASSYSSAPSCSSCTSQSIGSCKPTFRGILTASMSSGTCPSTKHPIASKRV